MPPFLKHENENQVPSTALWLTNIVVQLFLVVTLFAQYAFDIALELTSAMTLTPHVLVAGYGLQLAQRGETYQVRPEERSRQRIIAAIATIYTLFMIVAGGLNSSCCRASCSRRARCFTSWRGGNRTCKSLRRWSGSCSSRLWLAPWSVSTRSRPAR
jgi:amino acid transporter